ncbi:hypothetical protein WISP_92783 [Willisornis vidua]|uniref:FGGY carbohydrate kinase domain-containing protein n=1 Tax=Willisornis vidua TaxID=1566151 RepID=A0ABQ9D0X3_9PASS|nr:hypothetical protein WISP_92783 [Willisornis vidua]
MSYGLSLSTIRCGENMLRAGQIREGTSAFRVTPGDTSAARDIVVFVNPGELYSEKDQLAKEVVSGIDPGLIRGIGFDATCSLVVLDKQSQPLAVNCEGQNHRNVMMWMDHRAGRQVEHINTTQHRVLSSVGGAMSVEMQPPKLLWIKENLPESWEKAGCFFDLPDFLSWKATGVTARSLCTVVCKWTYTSDRGWDDTFWEMIGLEDLVKDKYEKIGTHVLCPGEPVGKGLTPEAARELGLPEGLAVAASLIDAHAGGLGVIGADVKGHNLPCENQPITARVAMICGTSSCHMGQPNGSKELGQDSRNTLLRRGPLGEEKERRSHSSKPDTPLALSISVAIPNSLICSVHVWKVCRNGTDGIQEEDDRKVSVEFEKSQHGNILSWQIAVVSKGLGQKFWLQGEFGLLMNLNLLVLPNIWDNLVSEKPIFVPGVWGPYFSAMVPGLWLNEGGQSATGKLIDHVVRGHVAFPELQSKAAASAHSIYTYLNSHLELIKKSLPVGFLTVDLHVWPDFHGNRSPLTDLTLKGMVVGLTLSRGLDELALIYLATIQAIASGMKKTQTLVYEKNSAQLVLCEESTYKEQLGQRFALEVTFCHFKLDFQGKPVVLSKEVESVLVGAAILGACASGDFTSIQEAMAKMGKIGRVVQPNHEHRRFYDKKYEVFLKLVEHQREYRSIMNSL